eukprot:TRINITY_DN106118_c0_g1_i1.p2 TRINITY_DN106118_c0_g1~~TRINITY_DN106118_c0_g1_i1.p2  ORF type:complete len:166 (-),score=28.14 TRINITY_DN106118_c0_g1_i1:494-955(-)
MLNIITKGLQYYKGVGQIGILAAVQTPSLISCQGIVQQSFPRQDVNATINREPWMNGQRRFIIYKKRDIKRRIAKRFEQDEEFEDDEDEQAEDEEFEIMGEPTEKEGELEEEDEEVDMQAQQEPKDYSHIQVTGQPYHIGNIAGTFNFGRSLR